MKGEVLKRGWKQGVECKKKERRYIKKRGM